MTQIAYIAYSVRINPIPQHEYLTESQHSDIRWKGIRNVLLLESSLTKT